MKITKFGHSCFLVEENGVKILFDPGNLCTAQDDETGIDLILITHDHQDHLYVPSVRAILAKNPKAKILTNKGVGLVLDKEKIPYGLLEHGQSLTFKDVLIEGFGEEHAVIYPTLPRAVNTGYFIANKLFFPGDALYDPKRPVEVLALPAFAPWSKIEETVDYAKKVNAGTCFAVHDAILARPEFVSQVVGGILRSQGVKFTPIEINKGIEF
jgi:L-ascorbate metabolism protein UlaG (beta-lactamase superfamily)